MNEEQKPPTQPLYEFVADEAYPEHGVSPGSGAGPVRQELASAPLPSDEEIRRGLIYPPPPSFYQNMQIVSAASEEGQVRNAAESVPSSTKTVDEKAARQPYREMGQPGDAYPHYPPAYIPAPPAMQSQPPPKRSRAWIWIVAVTLSTALLVSCGLCGWGMYTIFSSTFQQVVEPLTLTQNYYSALQAKNYSLAYSYLSPQGTISGLNLDQFTQQASSRDSQFGAVRSYAPGQPAFSTSTTASGSNVDLNRATVTVDVSRSQQSYSVLLTMQKVGGKWKIIDYDRL